MPDRQEWRQYALCATLSIEESDKIFFIGPGQTSKRAQVFCRSCPVKRECKDFAITYNEWGIWAGQTEDDRRKLDPFIRKELRKKEPYLESRNIDDFIPKENQQVKDSQPQTQLPGLSLLDQVAFLLTEVERLEEQSEVPVHPFDRTSVPRAIGQ